MKQLNNIKSELLVRYLSGEISPEEELYVENWRKQSDANKRVLEEYRQIWNYEYQSLLPEEVKTKDWENIRTRIQFSDRGHKVNLWKSISRIAAIFIIMLGVSGALYTYWNVPGFGRWAAFQTGNYVDSLQLPDNSVVFLNNNSSLKYLKNFKDGKRKVALNGEGFFDVVSDKNNPFRVNTPEGVDVEVKGTAFQLQSGRGIKNLELNVTDGVVYLSYKDHSKEIDAGNSAYLEDNSFAVKPISDNNFLAWKSGELVFSNSSLSTITKTLQQHYDEIDKINIQSETNVKVTTSFKNQTLSDVLEELEIHFDKKFQLKDGVLKISD